MQTGFTDLAAQFGLSPVRVLQQRPGRVTLQTEDERGERYVLKTATAAGELTGDVEGNRILADAGIPVPTIVAYHDGSPSVLILRWIDGEPLSSASPPEVQQTAGQLIRSVHQLPGGPPFSGQPTIAGWITAWTTEVLDWWASAGAGSHQIRRVLDWLDDLEPVLAQRTGTLTLFDGRADHFLVHQGKLAGLIDLHDVGPGDPAMDLATLGLTDEALISGVLEGYLESDQDDDLDELIPFYLLLRRLAGAEWQLRIGSEREGRRLLRLAGNSLALE